MPCGGGEASVLGEREEIEMRKLAILTAFLAGYVVNDMVGEFAPVVHAEVAGMDRYDLKRDRDFKRAVEDIAEDVIEDCEVSGGYVDGDYIYGTREIEC